MPPHDFKDQTADEIAAMLERERQGLAASLGGLRSRLSADMLVDDAIGYLNANIGPYARSLDGAVRSNPMAAVLTGVGLAWLVLGRKRAPGPPDIPMAGTKFGAMSRWEDEGGYPAPDQDADADWMAEADALRDRASNALAQIEADARDQFRPAAELARDRTKVLADLAGTTRVAMLRGLEGLTHKDQTRVLASRENAYVARLAAHRPNVKLIERHPILTAAIGMAIGAVVASALPHTRTEDRLFGQERDRLLARAEDALRQERARAGETMSRLAESVATKVKNSARDLVQQA